MKKHSLLSFVILACCWMTGNSAWAIDQDTEGYYLIGSKADLLEWKGISGYESTNARLTADVDDVDFMLCENSNSYTGIFDGDGHTITVNINATKEHGGLFYNMKGTIRNLVVGGTFTARNKNCGVIAGYSWSDNTKFENVVCVADIKVDYTANASNGGFLGATKYKCSFTNCVSAIHVEGNQGYNHGFVGWVSNSPTITIKNCISIADVTGTAANGSLSWGNPVARFNISNSYSLKTSADAATPLSSSAYAEASEFSSGKIAYTINTVAGDNVLYQSIETDDFPYPFSSHGTVYASGRKHCDLSDYSGVVYNNISDEVVIDDHIYNKGFCTNCGGLDNNYLTANSEGFYELGNADDVEWFAAFVNNGATSANAKLTADIKYEGVSNAHTPIGAWSNKYEGNFDGQGHKIMGMDIDMSTTDNIGFFGVVTGGAIIENIIIDSDCSIRGANRIGGIAGCSVDGGDMIIRNCINRATVSATNTAAGILGAGSTPYSVIKISNCVNEGAITGGTNGASIVGWNNQNGSTVENCINIGDITPAKTNNWFLGDKRTIRNCYATNYTDVASHLQNYTGTWESDNEITSGELAYVMNKIAGKTVYYQNLSSPADATPIPISTSAQVFLNGIYQNPTSRITLDETKSFGANANFDADVTLNRTLKAGKWNTFCVPVDMNIPTGWEVKELTDATEDNGNYTMTFGDASSIEAGKPYMVRVSADVTSIALGETTVKAGGAQETKCGDLTYTGVYENGKAPTGSFIISNNTFYVVNSDVTLKAFRGYITVGGSEAKSVSFIFDEENADAINLTPVLSAEGAIYNIAGQRVNKAQKGVNIVNGKKIVF